MKKRIMSFVLTVVLCCVSVMPAFAATIEEIPIGTVDQVLLQRGYPQKVLDILCDEAKQDLYDQDCVFDEAVTEDYDENLNLISTKEITASEEPIGIMPFGQIKTSNLSLTWVTSKNSSGNIVVTYNYNWKTMPLNRWQDPIAVSWDSKKFSMKTGSFRKVDKYIKANQAGQSLTETKSDEKAYAKGSASGVVWYADLKGTTTIWVVVSLYGYATFTLEPTTKTGSSKLYGHYVHKKISVGVSLSITGFGSFGVSGSGYDELGNQKDVTW